MLKNDLKHLSLVLLLKNAVISSIIAATLQKRIKALLPFPIVAKLHGI